jgi:hypothetical protein
MDLKRYVDRNGKGPAYPLPTQTIKVGLLERQMTGRRGCALLGGDACLCLSLISSLLCAALPLNRAVHRVPAGQGPGALPQARGHAPRPQAAKPAGELRCRGWSAAARLPPAAAVDRTSIRLSALPLTPSPHPPKVDDATMTIKIADLGLGRAFSIPVKSYTHEVKIAHGAADGTAGGQKNVCLHGKTKRRFCCSPCLIFCRDQPPPPKTHIHTPQLRPPDRHSLVPRPRGAAGHHPLLDARRHVERGVHHGRAGGFFFWMAL